MPTTYQLALIAATLSNAPGHKNNHPDVWRCVVPATISPVCVTVCPIRMTVSQLPPAKPEAWQRWSGSKPRSPSGDDSSVCYRITPQIWQHGMTLRTNCGADRPPHVACRQSPHSCHLFIIQTPVTSQAVLDRIPEPSNFESPPAEPEDFLWINESEPGGELFLCSGRENAPGRRDKAVVNKCRFLRTLHGPGHYNVFLPRWTVAQNE